MKELREVIAPLPDATQAKILGAIAADIYRLLWATRPPSYALTVGASASC